MSPQAEGKNAGRTNGGPGVAADAARALVQQQYEHLAQAQPLGPVARLFFELTGWRLGVAWAPPPPLSWENALPFSRSAFCKRVTRRVRDRTRCQRFERQCLARALQARSRGHAFTCPFGVRSVWIPVVLGLLCIGIVFFQVPTDRGAGQGIDPKGTRSRSESPKGRATAQRESHFNLARRLLRFVARDLVASVLAEARRGDIERLSRDVTAHEHLETRLRRSMHKVLPFVGRKAPLTAAESHREQIVHRLLEHVQEHYGQPISLGRLAEELRMNAAHLSALFSRTVGLPFRSYVKQLRLEKAQQLLGDPLRRVSEVAYAVGYTEPNRFRLDSWD